MSDSLSRWSEVGGVSCLQGISAGELEAGQGDWERLGGDEWDREGVLPEVMARCTQGMEGPAEVIPL